MKKALERLKVINETPERKALRDKLPGGNPGYSETWKADEEGWPGLPHPDPGNNVIEIYDPEIQKDPEKQKQSVFGEGFHLMHDDPEYQKLWNEFKDNYSPEEAENIKNKRGGYKDANGEQSNPVATHDAYIRGWFTEPDVMKWQKESGNTLYSPKQVEILKKIGDYIETEQEEIEAGQ
jgi:hypothetical protein